jgi:hypothetical protein
MLTVDDIGRAMEHARTGAQVGRETVAVSELLAGLYRALRRDSRCDCGSERS